MKLSIISTVLLMYCMFWCGVASVAANQKEIQTEPLSLTGRAKLFTVVRVETSPLAFTGRARLFNVKNKQTPRILFTGRGKNEY